MGTVRAEVVGSVGQPVIAGARAYLFFRPVHSAEDAAWQRCRAHGTPVANGRASFERVGLGLDLSLTAWLDEAGSRGASAEARGPTRVDEEVVVRLALGAAWPRIRARAIDERGSPLADRSLSLQLVYPAAEGDERGDERFRVPRLAVQTDADGRFETALEGDLIDGCLRVLELLAGDPPFAAQPSAEPRSARLDLSRPLPSGAVCDLGDVVLPVEPVLVAGAVVDTRGTPVPHAWISVVQRETGGGEPRWNTLQPSRPLAGADGRFSVRARAAAGELQVEASRKGHTAARATGVIPGTSDLVLVLERGAALSGRVLLDPGIAFDLLHVALAGDGIARDVELWAEGFSFDGLRSGIAAVEVRTQETDWVVARVEGLVIAAGEGASDARLNPIDLRGRLALLRLRLWAPDRSALSDAAVRVENENGRGGSLRTDRAGRLIVLVDAREPRFTILASGCAPAKVDAAAGEIEVSLEPE
jgi:hypothetical protein